MDVDVWGVRRRRRKGGGGGGCVGVRVTSSAALRSAMETLASLLAWLVSSSLCVFSSRRLRSSSFFLSAPD